MQNPRDPTTRSRLRCKPSFRHRCKPAIRGCGENPPADRGENPPSSLGEVQTPYIFLICDYSHPCWDVILIFLERALLLPSNRHPDNHGLSTGHQQKQLLSNSLSTLPTLRCTSVQSASSSKHCFHGCCFKYINQNVPSSIPRPNSGSTHGLCCRLPFSQQLGRTTHSHLLAFFSHILCTANTSDSKVKLLSTQRILALHSRSNIHAAYFNWYFQCLSIQLSGYQLYHANSPQHTATLQLPTALYYVFTH